MSAGRMVLNPFDVLRHAKRLEWDAKQLAASFNGMTVETAQKLLDGSAIIQNVQPSGAFDVYHPGRMVG